ncbi:hypothetical protein KUCAC02_021458, partial [Chaenocephalus aceratus]
ALLRLAEDTVADGSNSVCLHQTFPPRLLSLISRMEWQDNQAEHWPKPGMLVLGVSELRHTSCRPSRSITSRTVFQVCSADIEFDAEPSVNPSPGADQDPRGLFTIDIDTGDVSVSRSLDREAIDSYE